MRWEEISDHHHDNEHFNVVFPYVFEMQNLVHRLVKATDDESFQSRTLVINVCKNLKFVENTI